MEEIVERFLAVGYGSGDGSGDGYGDGSGDGYGDGSGDGYGSGYGDGYGYGSGDGSGDGDGDGYGDGSGYGDGYGYGYGYGYGDGYGYGYGITKFNGEEVYLVDGMQTIIRRVHGQYAEGAVLQDDLTLKECFIAKCGNYFAHGETLADAVRDARAKYEKHLPLEERIRLFQEKYPTLETVCLNADLFTWHHTLTGSCLFGRKKFAERHGIDVENGSMTVAEFIELTKDAFGREEIRQLKESYKQ